MASWMVHLRIADRLLEEIPGLAETEFVVGNIAPDSGVPNEDWSAFSPSITISHFQNPKLATGKYIDLPAFIGKYFTKEQQLCYDRQQKSFFLGYLCHLITDIFWSERIFRPTMARFPEGTAAERNDLIRTVKADWYDLDYLYLQNHPDFRAFRIYQNAVGFPNTFMQEFSEDAFDNRRAYITEFYLQGKDGLDREYPYLTEAEVDRFVETSVREILERLENCLVS